MLNGLKNATNVAYTENGARAYKTTKSAVLDMFAQGGALRQRSESDIISMYTKAFAENPLLAMKLLFYLRDVRGGQGERRTFRTIVKYMANNHPQAVSKNLWLFPHFARWDDLYELVGTKLEGEAFDLIREQFYNDLSTNQPSLLGKWLKSENASSPITRKLGRKTREVLGLSPKKYRKALTDLRQRINIVETQMSQKEFSTIDYSKLPSQAGLRYRQAFFRNDLERYTEFLEALKTGKTVDGKEVKINTATLYPYQIVAKIPLTGNMVYRGGKYYTNFTNVAQQEIDVLNAMWDNLPNYFGDKVENSIAVVDTSGSMTSNNGLPIQTAISLGIYTAERNRGPYHNHFITFSGSPELVEIQGSNIVEKVRNMSQANWNGNTNIEAVFNLILQTAIKNRLSQDDMIERVYIISDMEFDACATNRSQTLFEAIRLRYANAGYTMPNLVFWNVNARNAQFPMTMTDTGVQLVSGHSPSIFTNLLKGKMLGAYEMMLQVLEDARYSEIRV
jgi:hypothetical protein